MAKYIEHSRREVNRIMKQNISAPYTIQRRVDYEMYLSNKVWGTNLHTLCGLKLGRAN